MADDDFLARIHVRMMDPELTARISSTTKSMLESMIDSEPDSTLSDLFGAWNTYNRDVERWARLKYRDERRNPEWVDIGEAGC